MTITRGPTPITDPDAALALALCVRRWSWARERLALHETPSETGRTRGRCAVLHNGCPMVSGRSWGEVLLRLEDDEARGVDSLLGS
jgi:hypothetical protein